MKVILLLYWISRGVYIREVKPGEFNGRRQAGARVRARSSHERDSEQNMSTESCWNAGTAVDGVGDLFNSAPHSTTPITSETVRGIELVLPSCIVHQRKPLRLACPCRPLPLK